MNKENLDSLFHNYIARFDELNYIPENDEKMVLVAREIAKRIEDEMDYPGQIKVNLIRESRAVEYAK